MDAITMLRNDHRTVEGLFKRFEKLTPRALKTMRDLNERIIEELAVHAVIEEQVFYPAVREAVPDVEDTVLEALEEHHVVKWTLSELDGMDPAEERFRAKVTVLIESVRHHVEEEEQDLFPKVRDAMTRTELASLGEAMAAAREGAPTRPHPKAPDEPPGNIVAGAGAALLDKARDAGRTAVREVGKKAKEASGKAGGKAKQTRDKAKAAGKEATSSAKSRAKSGSKAGSKKKSGSKAKKKRSS